MQFSHLNLCSFNLVTCHDSISWVLDIQQIVGGILYFFKIILSPAIIMNSHRTQNHQESVSLKKKFRFFTSSSSSSLLLLIWLFTKWMSEWVMVWNRLTEQRNVSKVHAKDFNSFWHGVNTRKFIYFMIMNNDLQQVLKIIIL